MGGQVMMVLVSHKWRGLDSIPGHHSRVRGRDMTQPSALQDKVIVQFPVKDKLSWGEAGAEGTKKQRAEAEAEAGPRRACMTVLRPAYPEVYLDWVWPCLSESTGMLLFNAATVEVMSTHSHTQYTSLPDFMPRFTMTCAPGSFVPVTSARWGGPLAVAHLPSSALSDQLEIDQGELFIPSKCLPTHH